jgi:PAS domain S-box-containing protein
MRSVVRFVLLNAAIAVVYFVAAKLGLMLALPAPQVTAVWPPTGLSLAAVIVFGYRVAPGIALGAFAANITTQEPLLTASAIGVGNTLEAVLGAWLLINVVGFRPNMTRVRDVLGLVLLAAGLSTTISATIGVVSLCLGGVQPWLKFPGLWWQWWLGDAVSDIVLAPLLLTWSAVLRRPPEPRRIAELLGLFLTLALVTVLVFGGQAGPLPRYPLVYLVFPVIIWAALRFSPAITSTVTFTSAVAAIWATIGGWGPFAVWDLGDSLMLLQAYIGVTAVTALVVSAVAAERRRAARRLRRKKGELADFVENATIGLQWVGADGKILWVNRAELEMLGYEEHEYVGHHIAEFHVDQPAIGEILDRLSNREELHDVEARLRCKDGSIRHVLISSSVLWEGGEFRHTRCFTTDITRRKQAMALLDGQRRLLELVAGEAPLTEVLEKLVHIAEEQSTDGLIGVIHLAEDEGSHLVRVAAPSLPQAYRDAIADIPVAKESGISGAAAHDRTPIVVEDMAAQPRWAHHREIALAEGLKGAWAVPITASDGNLLGTFTVYYRHARTPGSGDRRLISMAVRTAGLAIERRLSEQQIVTRARQQDAVARLGQLALAGADESTLFDEAVRTVSRVLNVEYCKVLEWLPDNRRLVLKSGVGWKPGIVGQAVLGTERDSQAGYTLAVGAPVIVRDLRTEDRFRGAPLLFDHEVVSGLSLIIPGEGTRPYGVLGAHSKRRVTFARDDVNFLQSVANILAAAVQNRRVKSALQASKEEAVHQLAQLHAIYESAPVGLGLIDREFRYLSINARMAAINGVPAEDHIGRTVREVIPELADEVEPVIAEVYDTGAPRVDLEIRGITRADPASERDWLVHYCPVKLTDGSVVGVNAVVQDITDRKRSESTMRLLANAGKALAASLDYDSTLNRLVYAISHRARELAASLDYDLTLNSVAGLVVPGMADWCAIDLATEEGLLRPVAVVHSDPAKVELARDMRRRFPPRTDAPRGAYHVLRTGESELFADFPDDLLVESSVNEEHLQMLRGVGIRSAAIVPLVARGRVLGTMTLVIAESRRRYNPSDVQVFEELARVCGMHVDNALLYRDAQQEIAERTRTEAELRQTDDRLRFTLTAALVGTWAWNMRTGHVEWSDNLEAIHGRAPGSFGGTFESFLEDVHPEDRDLILRSIASAISEGGDYRVEYRVVRADGGITWIEGKGRLMRDDRGQPIGMAGICMDITERHRVDEELHRAKNAAEAASRAKSGFLANVSHELRTPMNAIIGMTDLAIAENPPQPIAGYLRTAKESATLLMRLLNDLLDVSKIESGRFELDFVPFRLRDTVDEAFRTLLPRAAERNLELTYEVAGDVPDELLGDPLRLQQVLINLVGNGVKFTSEGSVRVHVARDADSARDVYLRFSVKDTGIGISREDQERIFSPFTQVDLSSTRRFGGAGLGLAICAQLVAMMKGSITVNSVPGQGAEFVFTARFQPAIAALAGPFRPAADSRLAGAPRAAAPRRALTVLLAEDTHANQELVISVLSRYGHRVHVARNGRQAVDMYQERPYDVILMDVQMPVLDGLEATRQIRTLESASGTHVPIVAMTAHAMQGDRERCLAAGMDDYLPKPLEVLRLEETVRNAAARKFAPACGGAPQATHDGNGSEVEAVPVAAAPFDPQATLRRLDGDVELFRKMIGFYLEDSPELLGEIHRGIQSGDARLVERAAHTLKGLAANLDGSATRNAAARVEDLGRLGNLNQAEAALRPLAAEAANLAKALRAYQPPPSAPAAKSADEANKA